jgi:peptide/nickel transport system substrate-binding protein
VVRVALCNAFTRGVSLRFKKRPRGPLTACVLATVLLIAACGGTDSKDAAKSTSKATTTTTTEAESTTTSVAGDIATTSTSAAKTTATTARRVTNAAASRNQASVGATRQLNSSATTLPPDLNRPPADWNPDGELRVTFAGGLVTLDPLGTGAQAPYVFPLYDRLTELADDYTVIPRLASSWTFPDSKTMVLKLRTDAKFHDGTPIDAAAVKANIDRARTLATSTVKVAFAGIASVEAVDATTVKLNLSSGGAELPVVFSQMGGAIVNPKALSGDQNDIGTKGVGGSGAYKLESYKVGDQVVLSRNPDFWDKREALLKKLTILFISNGPQRMNALRAGDIDLAHVVGQDVAGAKRDSAAGIIKGITTNLTAGQNGIMLRDTLPPFDNPKVREAVAWALNKDGLNAGVYNGTCQPANQFFTPTHWSYAKSLDGRYKFDQAKAKQLLAESGVKDLSVTIDYPAIYQVPGEAIQQMLNDVGFDVKLILQVPGDTSFLEGKRHGTIGGPQFVIDPSQLVNGYFLGNYKLARDPDGSLAALARKGSDITGTQQSWSTAYQAIWERVYNSFVIIPTCNPQQFWAHTGKVANVEDLRYKFMGGVDFSYLYVKK